MISASGCAYRFTNLHLKTPEKISTIAIESVYDTGSEVLSHELLWDQLQRAFAANGHLKLSSVSNSDALLRARITQSNYARAGSEENTGDASNKSDPQIYGGKSAPLPPGALPDIKLARKYYPKDSLTYSIDVEVYDLATHKLLLQRTYSAGAEILSVRSDPNSVAFVRHEESADYAVAKLARRIADTVVSDLLVR